MRKMKVSIKSIICKDDTVLMLKDQKGNWELPGGGMEVGEHPEETLKRELNEELGIEDMNVGDLVGVWDFCNVSKEDISQHLIITYECSINFSKLNLSSEHLEMEWISLDRINEFQMRDGYRETIKKFSNRRKENESGGIREISN